MARAARWRMGPPPPTDRTGPRAFGSELARAWRCWDHRCQPVRPEMRSGAALATAATAAGHPSAPLLQHPLDQPRPIAGASGEDLIVEVIMRIVQAGALLAVADEDVAAGARLQHEGEILGAHAGREVADDIAGTCDLGRRRGGDFGLLLGVDRGRIAPFVADANRGALRGRHTLGDAADTVLDGVLHLRLEG